MTKFRRALCRVFGHARLLESTGRLSGGQKAIARSCSRCRTIVDVRGVSRQYRRNRRFGRSAHA